MGNSIKYQSAADNVPLLGSVIPQQLVEDTTRALGKLKEALGGDVSGYVANRLHMNMNELSGVLAAEQVDGVALAMYNIEKRSQSVIIGDQTGIGKGRQAAAMIRYGLLSGYLPIFFTDRYTLFSDMYRDCKALGIKDARPLVVNSGASVVDFDNIIEEKETETPDEIWSPMSEDEEDEKIDAELMQLYQKQYEVVYKAPKKNILQGLFEDGDIPSEAFDYLMITYSQLKDAKRDATRLNFLQSLCEKHRVLFIFDEAHRSSSVSAGKLSVITQGINRILTETPQTQCVFLSATFAKRPESLITFTRRTTLSALATENTLEKALHNGGLPMQEYVSTCLAAEGQMIRREHSANGMPLPTYTYLDDDLVLHSELFDKVMFFFRETVKLSTMVNNLAQRANIPGLLKDFKCYPTRSQLFYLNKVLLLSLKAKKVAQVAIDEVKQGKSVVIGMSDTLECILQDVVVDNKGSVRGDISTLLLRLLDKTVRNTNISGNRDTPIFDLIGTADHSDMATITTLAEEIRDYYRFIKHSIKEEVFHLPMSPIDVIRQLITEEKFISPDGCLINIRFEECTGRAHQLEYLSPDGNDDYIHAEIKPRKKRHSNHIFNDFQNNKLDVILINACGAIGASAHATSTAEVPENQVRQRKMLIVQNDLDVNIDLQKRGRINRTGQRTDLPPLYEYIITSIPSEKRLNMMLRAKLRSLSANTAGWQDQNKEQADFIDISNKYGNNVATDYIAEHQELAFVLGLKGRVTASKLLARIAMLSVSAQQEIVDYLMAAYTTLEAELRRINQWDLEREYRDFEADFVREELFTTGKADTKLGGCSYLTTYKCRQKTFPYTYESLTKLCDDAKSAFGKPFSDNKLLQNQIKKYYQERNKEVRQKFSQRRTLLHDGTKRILVNYCGNEALADRWLELAYTPSDEWTPTYFDDVEVQQKAKLIIRKLISFSNEYNHLLEREKKELNKYSTEKKRLIGVLSMAEIGKGYSNISHQLASEECPNRVIAVLRDIRFGKEDSNRFLPSRVEFIFALSAVFTEVRVNLVHNNKWSNYDRLVEILKSEQWRSNAGVWDSEIASNNNKIVERKIITGNILGAYVHPAIAELKPRFITFSLKNNNSDKKVRNQIGLLLPMDEAKIREAIKTVSIPLHEGVKYATNTNTSYTIAGLGVNFSLLPYRMSETKVLYAISVCDKHSKIFEDDNRFDGIRQLFNGTLVTSIYENDDQSKTKKKSLMHYQTAQLYFDSEALQLIIQTLAQMDAVIIVPREQMSYGDVKELSSRSIIEEDQPWAVLDWENSNDVPMPPVREKTLLRISAPIVQKAKLGEPVFKHSEYYLLAEETMSLDGLSLNIRSTLDALRRIYMKWKAYYSRCISQRHNLSKGQPALSTQRDVCRELRIIIENKTKLSTVNYDFDTRRVLQAILDSEYLEANGLYLARFDNEMLFLSPDKSKAQAFLDEMPCSPNLDAIRKCIQDYIDGKTDIIYSADNWL
ncbi:MAG: strawberry notch family protein [Paludibacteraceae bacterium]|nr:strawberry notch family protein [Paludibacteraceae bacterium]